MNRRFASVLIFSLVVAALTSCLVYYFVVTNVEAASRKPSARHKLLVAARTLEAGTLLQESDLRWNDTAEAAPPAVVNDMKQAVGRGVLATIFEGEPIADGRVAAKGAGAGLAALIPAGKRAVALKVDEVVGLAGFVVPGMRVDVVASARDSASDANGVSAKTVLQNIEVLSAGQKFEKTGDGKPQDAQVVNLLVTPDQAEVLSLASSEAKVQLVLRNPLDTDQEATHGTSLAQIFGHELPVKQVQPRIRPVIARAVVPPPPAATVEMFSGIKKSEQTLASQ